MKTTPGAKHDGSICGNGDDRVRIRDLSVGGRSHSAQTAHVGGSLRIRRGASDAGKVRVRNEDHYLVSKVSRNHDVLSTNITDNNIPSAYGDDPVTRCSSPTEWCGMAAGEVAAAGSPSPPP